MLTAEQLSESLAILESRKTDPIVLADGRTAIQTWPIPHTPPLMRRYTLPTESLDDCSFTFTTESVSHDPQELQRLMNQFGL